MAILSLERRATMKTLILSLIVLLGYPTLAQMPVGSGALGVFDPSHEDDPIYPQRVWRSYSVVDISPLWKNGVVSTRVAYSDNNGKSFTDLALVNPSTELPYQGLSWAHEVSSLLYEPADPNSYTRWKLIWEKHLVNKNQPGDQRDFRYSWIAMKAGINPAAMLTSEMKLLAGNLYDPNNSLSPGQPAFALPASLSDCAVLTEPSTMATTDGFYMTFNCAKLQASETRFPLVKFRRVPGTVSLTLETKGNILTATDAIYFRALYASVHPDLRNVVSFSAPDIFEKNGIVYLIISPTDINHNYLGCAVFQLTSLEPAAVKRLGPFPEMIKYIPGNAGTFRGACTYSKNSTGSGVVLSQYENTGAPFGLVNTLVQVP
jgi:hypothetical protein